MKRFSVCMLFFVLLFFFFNLILSITIFVYVLLFTQWIVTVTLRPQ